MSMRFKLEEVTKVIVTSDLDAMHKDHLIGCLDYIRRKWNEVHKVDRKFRYSSIVDFVLYNDRVENLLESGMIQKTKLVMAYRAETGCAEATARSAINFAINKGDLIETALPGSRFKYIGVNDELQESGE